MRSRRHSYRGGGEGVRLGEGVEVESELGPVDVGDVEGGGPNGADGGGVVVAAGGRAEGQVDAVAGGRPAGAGGWKEGKYCIMCWVLMPSSRSLSLSERKVIDSSFFFKLESRLVILVCAKFSCIFRYSLLAAS